MIFKLFWKKNHKIIRDYMNGVAMFYYQLKMLKIGTVNTNYQ